MAQIKEITNTETYTLKLTTHDYIPFPCTGKSHHSLQPTETQNRLREEDAFKSEDALHRYDVLTEYPWA